MEIFVCIFVLYTFRSHCTDCDEFMKGCLSDVPRVPLQKKTYLNEFFT